MSEGEKPHKGRIDAWTYVFGLIYGYVGDDAIRTSTVVHADLREGGEIETRNSRYTLGKPLEF